MNIPPAHGVCLGLYASSCPWCCDVSVDDRFDMLDALADAEEAKREQWESTR